MSSPFQKAFSNKSPLGYVSIQPAIAGAYKAAEGHISNLKDLKGKEKQKEAFKNIGQDDYTQADYDIDYPKASTSTSSESLDARNNAEADYYRSLIIDPEVGKEVNEGVEDLNYGSEVSKTPDHYFSKYLKK
jgi:hypothetical protein